MEPVQRESDEAGEASSAKSFEIRYLEPAGLRFRYADATLTLAVDESTFYPRVSLRGCFPLSGETSLITVRQQSGDDEPDAEIGVVRDLSQLDAESYQAVMRELRLHYLVPTIQRIVDIREEFGFLYWEVETDRGAKEFIMYDSVIAYARQVSAVRWLLIDINQARYEIYDQEALDAHSLKLLKLYLLL